MGAQDGTSMNQPNPPYCPTCGSGSESFVQITDAKTKQPTPYGVCKVCFEMLKVVPLSDKSVAPFFEVLSHLAAPAGLIQARTQIRMQIQ
jgi:hypothetical protein